MISIRNLKKSFGDLRVLNGINLEVKSGEILTIMGKSGSGKSVLLKHLIGLSKPNSGEILIEGSNMAELNGEVLYKKLKSFGMILQSGALFDSLTIEENVGFYLTEHLSHGQDKLSKSEILDRVNQALKSVDLEGTNKMLPSQISGGMRKRAAIARSVSYQPSYLFYDEPTAGLDPPSSQVIGDLILREHKKLNGTTVVVSHDVYTILRISNRIAFISDGLIKKVGTPQEFIDSEDSEISKFLSFIKGGYNWNQK